MTFAVLALVLVTQQQGPPAAPPPRFPARTPLLSWSAAYVPEPAPAALAVAGSGAYAADHTPRIAPAVVDTPLTSPPAPVAADTPAAGQRVPTAGEPAMRPGPVAARDTPVTRRPRAVEYSDWYARRLTVHRVASYTLLPLLGLQYYTGTQLMSKGSDAPDWVIRAHAPLATASAVVFGVNTVTGVWNLWDARHDPNGRASRTAHGLLMLAADAGFLVAGSMGHRAVEDASTRRLHRTIALSSMGVALVSYAIMLPPFRR